MAINRRFLPIKAHFFFFMGAMGPILPQLPVLGKQIGIEPEVYGYISAILPMLYIVAKPGFGYLADYFPKFRKTIFITLISVMLLAYGALYFASNAKVHPIEVDTLFNVSFITQDVAGVICSKTLLTSSSLCEFTRQSTCTKTGSSISFEAYFASINSSSINLSNNIQQPTNLFMCFTTPLNILSVDNASSFDGTCRAKQDSTCLYTSFVFWEYLFALCVGTIGYNVVNSISDAICFDVLGQSAEDKYGLQRVWGTIGFGLTSLIGGYAVSQWTTSTVKSFTPALIVMFICGVLDLFSASKLKLPKLTSSESIIKDVRGLLVNPAITSFLIFATIAGILDGFIIYFMFWHMEEVAAATGYMDQVKLIEAFVVAAECLGSEVPFFFYSGKIIKKLGYVNSMSLSLAFYAIRLALIAWIPNPWYLVGVECFFQGITYALCYTCIVAYASEVAPPGTSATVQGLMAGMDDGVGFSIGALVGGLAFKYFGGRRSFAYFSILAIVTCLAHIVIRPSSRKRQYLPKSGYKVPDEQATVTVETKE